MDALIYDRTLLDIASLTAKAYHEAADLNRVEEWTAYVAGLLNGYGYAVTIVTKTDWMQADGYTLDRIERIRDNIEALQAAFYSLPDWREIVHNDTLTYEQANALEYDLHALGVWVERMVAHFDFIRSGDLYSGEEQL